MIKQHGTKVCTEHWCAKTKTRVAIYLFLYNLNKPIGHTVLGEKLVYTCKKCGWKPEEYEDFGNHSGRKGSIQTMNASGATSRSIAKISRHLSLESLKAYDDHLNPELDALN